MTEIDVRQEIETFRFADGEPGENNVCVYDGYLVINGDGKQEVEIQTEDVDNLIEALKRAKECVTVGDFEEIPPVKYSQASGWIKHYGGDCPVHPLDVVEILNDLGGRRVGALPAEKFFWPGIAYYRHNKDEDDVPYCSNEGLEPWAEYVATDEDGDVNQFEGVSEDRVVFNMWWPDVNDRILKAPRRYSNNFQHWTETLRRVHRG